MITRIGIARIIIVWFVCFLMHGICFAQDQSVLVTAELKDPKPVANKPIVLLIAVQHPLNQAIEEGGFKSEGKQIKVQLLQEIPVGKDRKSVISLYQWQMDGKPKGLYVLPSIAVNVGNNSYRSETKTITVAEGTEDSSNGGDTNNVQSNDTSEQKANEIAPKTSFIKLEALVDGPTTLYPGQRTALVYRYYFNDSIALSKEELPFLEPKGLKIIGETQVRNAEQGSLTASEVFQRVEAVNPGTFTLGPSHIEGYVWRTDVNGKRIYLKPPLTSDAPAVTINVEPFPEEGKPPSFNGAIGDFTFTTMILGPSEVSVGDKINLALEISGKGEFATLPMPEICCQPGFPGNFRPSDIPPIGVIKNGSKYFVADLWPLNPNITEVPSVEFSFFNPETKKYSTLISKPIPLIVHPSDIPFNSNLRQEGSLAKEVQADNSLNPSAQAYSYDNSWMLKLLYLIVPIAMAYVIYLIIRQQRNPIVTPRGSEGTIPIFKITSKQSLVLLHQAEENINDLPRFYYFIQQALMMHLVEEGYISNTNIPPQKLSTMGVQGKIRFFLLDLEQRRFAKKEEEMPTAAVLAQASALINTSV